MSVPDREEIIRLRGEGLTVRKIADHFGCSQRGVWGRILFRKRCRTHDIWFRRVCWRCRLDEEMPRYWKALSGMNDEELQSEIARSIEQNRKPSIVAKRKLLAKFLIDEKHMYYYRVSKLLQRDRSTVHHLCNTCSDRWTGQDRKDQR